MFIISNGTLGGRMPVYSTVNAVTALSNGAGIEVWNAETPTPGNGTTAASQQLSIPDTPNGGLAGISIDGKFSGAPGVFEVDVQVAAIDSDTSYQTVANGNMTTVDATNNTFHMDLQTASSFIRLLMRSRTNSVTISAYVSLG